MYQREREERGKIKREKYIDVKEKSEKERKMEKEGKFQSFHLYYLVLE